MFIVFEGLDSSGKTTQINLLSEFLKSKDYDYELASEPGTTEFGLKVRDIVLDMEVPIVSRAELMLYEAARAQVTDQIIKPALKAGKIVISDRYTLSSIAYQGFGRKLDLRRLKALDRWATGGLQPDLTIFLDIPIEAVKKRQDKNYKPDRLERENITFFKKVRSGYLRQIKKTPSAHRLDGAKTQGKLFQDIKNLVEPLLDDV